MKAFGRTSEKPPALTCFSCSNRCSAVDSDRPNNLQLEKLSRPLAAQCAVRLPSFMRKDKALSARPMGYPRSEKSKASHHISTLNTIVEGRSRSFSNRLVLRIKRLRLVCCDEVVVLELGEPANRLGTALRDLLAGNMVASIAVKP